MHTPHTSRTVFLRVDVTFTETLTKFITVFSGVLHTL